MTEAEKYYFQRTLEHVQRVQKNGFWLIRNHAETLGMTIENCRQLAYNLLKHDQSKFSPDEFQAYIDFSWAMKNKIKLTPEQQEAFNKAWKHHYTTENHHPERMKGIALKMSSIEIIETVCDLQAMAQEFGEASCRMFWESKWLKNQSENFYDDFDWEQTKALMRQVIDLFEQQPTI